MDREQGFHSLPQGVGNSPAIVFSNESQGRFVCLNVNRLIIAYWDRLLEDRVVLAVGFHSINARTAPLACSAGF